MAGGRIFLSYSRADKPSADQIRHQLESLGWFVFLDLREIEAGDEYPRVIDDALRSADVVVACWSVAAFGSDWCMRECQLGRLRQVLVPLAVQPFSELDMHVQFLSTNFYNLVSWTGEPDHDGWKRALGAINRIAPKDLASRVPRSGTPQEIEPLRSSSVDENELLVPVARDGSLFTPDVRGSRGFRIGPKGAEYDVEEFGAALSELAKMATPRWRRPNLNGIPGIVTGVRWQNVPKLQFSKFL